MFMGSLHGRKGQCKYRKLALTDYHFKQSDMIPEIVDAEGKTTRVCDKRSVCRRVRYLRNGFLNRIFMDGLGGMAQGLLPR